MLRAAAASSNNSTGRSPADTDRSQPDSNSSHSPTSDSSATNGHRPQNQSTRSAADTTASRASSPASASSSDPARSAPERSARARSAERPAARTTAAQTPSSSKRHSSRLGDSFPSLVGWTSLSALLPGIGLLRTRFRPLGWLLLLGFALIIIAALVYLIINGPIHTVSVIISSPTLRNILAIVVGIAAVIWIAVMMFSHYGLRKGHRYSPWQNKLAAVLVVSLALIIGIPLGVGSVFARVQSSTVTSLFGEGSGDIKNAEDLWADQSHINVFLIGRDSADDREGTRPDTMLVASIDTQTGNTALVSVPRNLAFPIFEEGTPLAEKWPDGFRPTGDSSVDLINSVWGWAEQNEDAVGPTEELDPGMKATMQAVEGSLGLGLDYWASVDMAGFEDVVDAIGGVKIDVERPIPKGGGKSLSGAPNEIWGWVDPGQQVLKGKNALWYVRSREGSDNYDRMCRQQRMLKTTLEQINPRELAIAYPKLANSATRNIATSIPQNEIPAFIELAMSMQKADITSVQINNNVTPTYNPDFDELHEWIEAQVVDASDGKEKPATTAASDGESAGEDSTKSPDEEADETAPSETAPSGDNDDESEAEDPGVANADGKCYPHGYNPGDPVPGYPGPGAGDEG